MKTIKVVQWLPFAFYLFPVIAGFTVISETPTILGFYSTSWFVLNIVNVCIFPAFYWLLKKEHLFGKCAVLFLICGITVVTLAKDRMRALTGIELVWPLIRLCAGFALLAIGIELLRANRKRSMLPVFLASIGLIAFSGIDVVMYGLERFASVPDPTLAELAPALQFSLDDAGLYLTGNAQNRGSFNLDTTATDALLQDVDKGKVSISVDLEIPAADRATAEGTASGSADLPKPLAAATIAATAISPVVAPTADTGKVPNSVDLEIPAADRAIAVGTASGPADPPKPLAAATIVANAISPVLSPNGDTGKVPNSVDLEIPAADRATAVGTASGLSDPPKPLAAATIVANAISPTVVPGCYVRVNSGFQLYSNYLNTRLFDLADILVVGDSVVDGTGVVALDSFPCQLEEILSVRQLVAKVHVLAFPGGSLGAYATLLDLVPEPVRLERIVIGFNYDDFPNDSSAFTIDKFLNFSLTKGSYTQRSIANALIGLARQNTDQFYANQVRNYDRSSPTFERRWGDVRTQLLRLRVLASKHSAKPPILIIFPLMISFENYPVEEIQAALAALAIEVGFQPLDVVPILRAKHLDGLENREGTHFNATVHQIIAEQLALMLD